MLQGVSTDAVGIVAVTYVRATDDSEGRDYLEDLTVAVERDNTTLVVRTIMPLGRQPSPVKETRVS